MRRLLTLLVALCLLPLPAPAAQGEQVIRLSFAGDCTLGGHEGWMSYRTGTFRVMAQEQNDYGYFLRHAREVFSRDDLTLVNLEGVLADSAKGRDQSRKWQFRGATEYTQILSQGSVEMVTLANNHSGDFGKPGLEATMAALEGAGIAYCLDDIVSYYEKDGIRLAFLGYWEHTFPRHREGLPALIRRLKQEEGCDAVIFNYHGGRQYWQKHRASQTEDMRLAIDAGADLVIGHHPHVLQGIEVYKGRHIVYSLGDFAYGGNRKPRAVEYPSMILGVELFFEGGRYQSQRLTIHPYQISGTRPRNNYQPLPAEGGQIDEVMAILQADTPFPLLPYAQGQGAVQQRVYAEQADDAPR